jgi:hypothetical protein
LPGRNIPVLLILITYGKQDKKLDQNHEKIGFRILLTGIIMLTLRHQLIVKKYE